MGSSSSKRNSYLEGCDTFEEAKTRAIKIYNYRMTHYNSVEHGPYELYKLQVLAEYERECIPVYLRKSRNFIA